jgi:16S rRNA (guanine1207-N2)-methyltransferase
MRARAVEARLPRDQAVDDAVLQALCLPFAEGLLRAPLRGRVLLLEAQGGAGLQRLRGLLGDGVTLLAEQSFRPFADALQAQGLPVQPAVEGRHAAVLLLAPRQRAQCRGLLVHALEQADADGLVMVSVANNAGAGAVERDLAELAGAPRSLSKHKCRVYWLYRDQALVNADLAAQWRAEAAPRHIEDGRFLSRPGVFAWDRIDSASALLAAHLPADLAGSGADLGAGYGYLSCEVLQRCEKVQSLHLYEAQAQALELARVNLAGCSAAAGRPIALEFHWHDVTRGLPGRYDFIVTNPPFHQGRADEPELGQAFLRAAARALTAQGRLLLVANRHLPYEQTLSAHFHATRVLADAQGFKVIQACEPRP